MNEPSEDHPVGVEIPSPFRDLPPERQKQIRRRVYVGSCLFLLVVAFSVAALNAYTSHKKRQAAAQWQPPGIPVQVLDIQTRDFEEVVEATGVIQPFQEVTVHPEVSGKVVRVEADLGDTVQTDAPLVSIDNELARLKVRQIQAQITKLKALSKDAEKNLQRKEKLFKRKTVSETDYDQASLAVQTNRGMLEEAETALEMARYELRHTVVRSPIRGRVAARFLEIGSLASPQTPVARVVNMEKVKVEVGLMDDEIRRVRVGQEVKLSVDALPGKGLMARVSAVGSQADEHTLTFPVRVERANSDPDSLLLPGMIARLSIRVKHHRDVIVVPREIVHEESGRPTVFLVKDSRASKRRLTLGPSEKDMVIVTSGLVPGDHVVCVGHEILDEGLLVQIDDQGRLSKNPEDTKRPPAAFQESPSP